jgi:hypothetical protein
MELNVTMPQYLISKNHNSTWNFQGQAAQCHSYSELQGSSRSLQSDTVFQAGSFCLVQCLFIYVQPETNDPSVFAHASLLPTTLVNAPYCATSQKKSCDMSWNTGEWVCSEQDLCENIVAIRAAEEYRSLQMRCNNRIRWREAVMCWPK